MPDARRAILGQHISRSGGVFAAGIYEDAVLLRRLHRSGLEARSGGRQESLCLRPRCECGPLTDGGLSAARHRRRGAEQTRYAEAEAGARAKLTVSPMPCWATGPSAASGAIRMVRHTRFSPLMARQPPGSFQRHQHRVRERHHHGAVGSGYRRPVHDGRRSVLRLAIHHRARWPWRGAGRFRPVPRSGVLQFQRPGTSEICSGVCSAVRGSGPGISR